MQSMLPEKLISLIFQQFWLLKSTGDYLNKKQETNTY